MSHKLLERNQMGISCQQNSDDPMKQLLNALKPQFVQCRRCAVGKENRLDAQLIMGI